MKFFVKEDILLRMTAEGRLETYSVLHRRWFPFGPMPEFVEAVDEPDAVKVLVQRGVPQADARQAVYG